MRKNFGERAVAVGIDIGGTDVKSGLVGADGRVVERRMIPTEASAGPPHVIARVIEVIRGFQKSAESLGFDVVGVGVGAPGSIDARRGAVIAPPNLPGWVDVLMIEPIQRAVGLPTTLENDANAAVVGEHFCGAGRGTRDMAMLTLGTGIGGGLIVGGALWHGRFGNAGELGHTIIVPDGRPCKCGQRGCLETYASAANTAGRARERIAAGEPSGLADVLRRNGTLTAQDVVAAARIGDKLAAEVWDETCRLLAVACVNLQHTMNFERIILAGGMSAAGEALLKPVRAHFGRQMWHDIGDRPEIILAQLGNDAGFIGNAHLALERAGNWPHDGARRRSGVSSAAAGPLAPRGTTP